MALEGQERVEGKVVIGTVRPRSFSVTAVPVLAGEPGGRSEGAIAVLHDFTDLRRLERVRRDFVANVSHEFKTPLTAIQGFAEHCSPARSKTRKITGGSSLSSATTPCVWHG